MLTRLGAGKAVASLGRLLADPLAEYGRLAARYGDAVRIPFSPRSSMFLLSRPEHAEHVLALNQDNYVKAFTYRPLRALIGNGLLTSEGEHWRRHRRLLQPLFSRRDVRSFGPVMTAAAQRLVKDWETLPPGSCVDVAGQMSALALDIVGRALFSTDLADDAPAIGRAMSAGQRVAVVATFLPLPWGPRTTLVLREVARRMGHADEGIEGPVDRMITGRRADLAAGSAGPQDLLQVLVAARDASGAALSDTEVGDELGTFMLAGHETSAVTLAWALALLSAYPAARERLEQEVDDVLGGREPEAADADALPWTTAVIAETMRLYPPAWTLERDALANDEVAGVPVPKGSTVAVPPYLVHRHPDFWTDPAGFHPARFLPPGQRRPRYAYIPFGGGRRACIGQAFAELETVLVLTSVAQRFRLELGPAGMPKPVAAVTLRPGRLPMRLSRR